MKRIEIIRVYYDVAMKWTCPLSGCSRMPLNLILSGFFFKHVFLRQRRLELVLLLQEKPTDPHSEFLTSRDANNLRQNDKNTLSSLMSRVPTLECINRFRSLRTFDVSNLSCGHLSFYFVVVNSICFILQKIQISSLKKTQFFWTAYITSYMV